MFENHLSDFESSEKNSTSHQDMKFVFSTIPRIIATYWSKLDGRTTQKSIFNAENVSQWCFLQYDTHLLKQCPDETSKKRVWVKYLMDFVSLEKIFYGLP